MSESTFIDNAAGDSGLAILSLGSIDVMWNVAFQNNTLSCPVGEYGFDTDEKVKSRGLYVTVEPKPRSIFFAREVHS